MNYVSGEVHLSSSSATIEVTRAPLANVDESPETMQLTVSSGMLCVCCVLVYELCSMCCCVQRDVHDLPVKVGK